MVKVTMTSSSDLSVKEAAPCTKSTYNVDALFRKNTLALQQVQEVQSDGSLNRVLTWLDLVGYGISATVGAGIFVVTGQVAREKAGPAIIFSFMVAGFSSLLSAFCYSEFAARVPLSGSAYTFSYVTLGELMAWFIGWNLTLEYAISASAVARSWSGNVYAMFYSLFGWKMPDWVWNYAIPHNEHTAVSCTEDCHTTFLNLSPLSFLIVIACTGLLLLGVKDSARINNVMMILNLLIISFVIVAGVFFITPSNWEPFFPFGATGVFRGAGTVFFSYIGFDSVTTLAGEVANPTRDLPIGIIGTLSLVTILYIGASFVVTGMVPYNKLNINAPLAIAFQDVGQNWAASMVAVGATTTLTATTFASLLGQPRIFYQMAKDGLLFHAFGVVSKNGSPIIGTIISGAFAAFFGFFFGLGDLSDMISIGTLMAFAVVCAGVVILRYQDESQPFKIPGIMTLFAIASILSGISLAYEWPWWAIVIYIIPCFVLTGTIYMFPVQSIPETFACPLVPIIPCLAMYVNIYLMVSLPWEAFARVFVWTLVGFAIYFSYGIRFSVQGKANREGLGKEYHAIQDIEDDGFLTS